MEGILL